MSQSAATASAVPAQPARLPTLMAAGIGGFMLSIDMFLVTVALPRIGADFAASSELVGWVVSANALMMGVFTIAAGRLGGDNAESLARARQTFAAAILNQQIADLAQGKPPGNAVDPRPLTRRQRTELKAALRQAGECATLVQDVLSG